VAAALAMTNVERAHELIARIRAHGVRDFCVCAGSRNSPLLAALSVIRDVHLYSFVDERVAAFFALGRAKRDGLPVAVVTTSGTAVAELLAAAVEAHYSGAPLVLLTADRPARFRGSGAPQAIEQEGIFGVYAEHDIEAWTKTHPLHVNVEFDEPLLGEQLPGNTESTAGSAGFQPAGPAASSRHAGATSHPDLPFRQPLVLLGALRPEDRERILEFALAYGATVYAEPLSGLREERALASQVVLNERMLSRGAFDGVVRIGGVPALRYWRDLDETLAHIPILHFARLPFAGLARGEVRSIDDLPIAPPRVRRDDDYLSHDRIMAEQVSALFDREPQSEPALMRAISRELPASSRVYLGNSLPIREWDLAATREPRGLALEANRGANGIDGQLSTFFGWCKPRVENVCIIGDLTALCDLGAAWICPQLNSGVRFRIIVVNNGGGRIFSRVGSLAPLDPTFRRRVIENEHTLRFDDWAAMWGIDYEWSGLVTPMTSEAGMRLVTELAPDAEATKRAWAAYDELWR
jgi:2-succinyl-5-enolpyruvyl-6-hydroxy-3-cyclohexene-1-carboxylate synthase